MCGFRPASARARACAWRGKASPARAARRQATVRLKIPPLTQNGQMFRLKGYGMPAVGKAEDKGDAYARVEAQLPTQLSPAEKEHYDALARLDRTAASKNSAA